MFKGLDKSLRRIFEEGQDNDINIYLKRDDGIKSNSDLVELAKMNNWKGKGSETNPYIVEMGATLPDILYLLKIDLYILFKNCNFKIFELRQCKNVLLQECSFETLNLSASSDIMIKNCSVSRLNILNSNRNTFDCCKIIPIGVPEGCAVRFFDIKSRANIFKNCELDNDSREIISKKNISSDIYLLTGLGIIIAFFIISIFQTDRIYQYLSIGLGFILILMLPILFLSIRRIIKPNKII
ncbi:MAG: hypothetical protein ACFE85_20030 [Candidatus Hodarchaeota archaeon]